MLFHLIRVSLSLAFFWNAASVADTLHIESDSGIYGPSYESILDEMKKVADENLGFVRVTEYGKSVKGRPLTLMTLMSANLLLSRRPAVILTGATHGNEYLNIADRLPRELTRLARTPNTPVNQFLRVGGVILFVPILNPDGYADRERHNAHGKDLNRDWDIKPAKFKGFKQVESTALGKYLDQLMGTLNLQYVLAVDYHCCLGGIIHPWSYQKSKIPAKSRNRHQKYGQLANSAGLDVKVGSASELIWYLPMGTTTDYHYSKYGALALTFEGRFSSESKRLDQHVNWWQLMLRELLVEITQGKRQWSDALPPLVPSF